ncbi:MAG: alpha/beta hydrolase [Anaerolineae bacterium]|nr:alpha/beta hydrolase [Anaerolineae bacterium]
MASPSADYTIPYGPDPLQFGDLRLPAGPGPFPVVVVIHGGFWKAAYSLDHIGWLCQALTRQGYATWSLEYRRVGQPGGGWPGTFLDVTHGVNHVRILARRFPLDLGRVAVIGHSAGGHLALWVAGAHCVPPGSPLAVDDPLSVRGAVSLAGVTDLRRAWELRLGSDAVAALLGGSPDDTPDRYAAASPQALLPLGVRQVIVHGTADPNVPYELGQRYYEAARALGDDVELLTLPEMGHFEVIDPYSDAWPTVLQAVAHLLT